MMRFRSVILIFLMIVMYCTKEHPLSVPDKLGSLSLSQKVVGKEADRIIMRLHIGKVTPGKNIIGYYQNGNKNATLYISTYTSSEEADSLLQRMAGKIGRGNYGFWHHVVFDLAQNKIHLTMGQGQLHYFFSRGNQVIWLAAPMEEGNAMLAEYLHIPVTDIRKAIQQSINKKGEQDANQN